MFNLSERLHPSTPSSATYNWTGTSGSTNTYETSDYSSVVFRTQLSTLEISENKRPFRVSLIDDFTAYSSYSQALSSTTVVVALTSIRSSLYQNSALTSETLTIDFKNLPCPSTGCEYVVEIPNRDKLDLSRDNIGPLCLMPCQNYTLFVRGLLATMGPYCANGISL